MNKLKEKISQYGRWHPLQVYISRIEVHLDDDFSISIENAKALLESIGKEICKSKGLTLKSDSSVNGVLKNAFAALGYPKDEMIAQISSSLANIGQHIGALRNTIGSSSHGKSLEELQKRNEKINDMTKYFLIDSIELIACLLIELFEGENIQIESLPDLVYEDCDDFNEYWDDIYGEFSMGDYSYTASEILYNNDISAYKSEYNFYKADELNNNEK